MAQMTATRCRRPVSDSFLLAAAPGAQGLEYEHQFRGDHLDSAWPKPAAGFPATSSRGEFPRKGNLDMTKLKSTIRVAALAGALLLASCGGEKPETLLAAAKDSLGRRDYKAAVIQSKNMLQQKPDSPEGRFVLGSALLELGDIRSAELELQKALDLKYPIDEVGPKLLRGERISRDLVACEW